MLPGTAKMSRPCSAAKSVVMSAPLFAGASVTSTPSASPEISRLRAGKLGASGGVRPAVHQGGGAHPLHLPEPTARERRHPARHGLAFSNLHIGLIGCSAII